MPTFKIPKEYKCLVDLINFKELGGESDALSRRASYWDNTIQIQVRIGNKSGIGSGLLLSNGFILTNYHVLNEQIKEAKAKLPQGITTNITEICCTGLAYNENKLDDIVLARAKALKNYERKGIKLVKEQIPLGKKIRIYGFKHGDYVEEDEGEKIKNPESNGFLNIFDSKINELFTDKNIFSNEINEDKYIGSTNAKTHIEEGWSGGPAIEIETGNLIGLNFREVKQHPTYTKKEDLAYYEIKTHQYVLTKRIISMIKHYLYSKREEIA